MLFWALLASGQITMRRVDGWQTLERSPTDLDFAADPDTMLWDPRRRISTTFATRPGHRRNPRRLTCAGMDG
jgi:hypothetical protein